MEMGDAQVARTVIVTEGESDGLAAWARLASDDIAVLIDEARLASSVDPEEAIWTARRAVASGSELRPACDERRRGHAVGVLDDETPLRRRGSR